MSDRDLSIVLSVAGLLVQTTLVLLLSLWVSRRFRNDNPALSHLVLVFGMVSVLAVPLVGPRLSSRALLTVPPSVPRMLAPASAQNFVSQLPDPRLPKSPPLYNSKSNAPLAEARVDEGEKLHYAWFFPLACLWAVGFLAVSIRSFHGFHTLWTLRRYGSIPFPRGDIDGEALARRSGYAGRWDLRECATREMAVPITWGIFRPTVMLPADADQWPKARLEAVVLHELAHVKRRDFFTQATAELACALFWFNPLVWMTAAALRADAETSADDAVLRAGLRPSDYAAELLQIAADLGHRRLPFIYVGTPAMRNSKIESRLHAVLSPNAGRRGVTSVQALAAVAVAVLAVPAFASLRITIKGQDADAAATRTLALSRIKQVALATLMYVNDYDDAYPYVQQTASAKVILFPYCKDKTIFESPTPGGKFLLNMNLAGVESAAIENPATTPMWVEVLPDAAMKFAVAFADGHAKSMADHDFINKGLKLKFQRKATSKPLPANWMTTTGTP